MSLRKHQLPRSSNTNTSDTSKVNFAIWSRLRFYWLCPSFLDKALKDITRRLDIQAQCLDQLRDTVSSLKQQLDLLHHQCSRSEQDIQMQERCIVQLMQHEQGDEESESGVGYDEPGVDSQSEYSDWWFLCHRWFPEYTASIVVSLLLGPGGILYFLLACGFGLFFSMLLSSCNTGVHRGY